MEPNSALQFSFLSTDAGVLQLIVSFKNLGDAGDLFIAKWFQNNETMTKFVWSYKPVD